MKKNKFFSIIIVLSTLLVGCNSTGEAQFSNANVYSIPSSNNTSEYSENNNIVYFHTPSIQVNKDDVIVINLSSSEIANISKVLVYSCSTNQEINIPLSKQMHFYVKEDGFYNVYAISSEDELLDLSTNLCIEHNYTSQTLLYSL